MYHKEEIKTRVMAALASLKENGTRYENIAVKLDMSNASVQNWAKGRRIPKLPVIRQIESLFRVRILDA